MEILEARRYLMFVALSVAANEFNDDDDLPQELMYENALAYAAREYIKAIDMEVGSDERR